ncbi:MAG TPA: glycosyltransferase family 4 protein [Parafilimonas sp.]|jgi:glycosyltransferase involved in cell wall biosynthesis
MKLGFIGSFPPRECGIATFTQNLITAIHEGSNFSSNDAVVIAMNDFKSDYEYPPKVVFTINQENQQDYIKAADYINDSDIDVCVLQHEYGIFGGESGIYILSLLNRLTTPYIVTLHTVLKEPSFLQKIILQEIATSAFKVVVMSNMGADFLKNGYHIQPEKIMLIEHGVPAFGENLTVQKDLQKFKNRKLLLSFGLLNRNKGIETVIKALPEVVIKHPEVLYVILGNTHPAILRQSGEEYRNYLKRFAAQLNLRDNIYFINKFVTDEQLIGWLKEIEIYITPYNNEAQITSGTLSYAIGAGAAVISTPYWHAQELLANNRGKLFPFKDSVALSEIINELLDNPDELYTIRHNAYQYGQHLKWPRIGARYWELAAEATRYYKQLAPHTRFPDADDFPVFNLTHIMRLTDNTGIVQHAKYGIPNLKEGYCLDDNTRALLMITMAYRQLKSSEALKLLPVYLSFVHYMQTVGGHFRNFLHFNRAYLDEIGSEDSFGRNIWALGYLIRYAPNNSYREFASELFSKSFGVFNELNTIRGFANTIIGISHLLKYNQSDEGTMKMLITLTDKLMNALNNESEKNWYWFEDTMTYDNGILPLALLHSYEITGNTEVKQAALDSMDFLKEKTFSKKYLTPVGNNGWLKKSGEMPLFDQQAIEVMAMVLLFEQAFQVTKDAIYIELMFTSFMWFLGENELHIPLYDHETHGCCDGLQYNGINRNQGAESTLAYLIAHLTVLKAMESEYEYKKSAEEDEIKQLLLT